jgi:hypothetical protein
MFGGMTSSGVEWIKSFEELWKHQLNRIKERAERRELKKAELAARSGANGKDGHESGQ